MVQGCVGMLGRMLAPAGARCVCQERLSQLAGTAGTAPPLPQKSPPARRGALAVGPVAAGGSGAVPRENTTPEEVPASPPAGPIGAVPGWHGQQSALCVPCHPWSGGKGWAGPALPPEPREGQQGSGQGVARTGRRGAGAQQRRGGSQSWGRAVSEAPDAGPGQPWRGMEHSIAPAVVAIAGNKPARGFGINYSFSKGTVHRYQEPQKQQTTGADMT